jgi:hypothetical protein
MPHGLERAGGWNMAPQATAIQRMEEEIQALEGRSGDALRSVRMRCGAMYSDMEQWGSG